METTWRQTGTHNRHVPFVLSKANCLPSSGFLTILTSSSTAPTDPANTLPPILTLIRLAVAVVVADFDVSLAWCTRSDRRPSAALLT